jgi:hypothetical protein
MEAIDSLRSTWLIPLPDRYTKNMQHSAGWSILICRRVLCSLSKEQSAFFLGLIQQRAATLAEGLRCLGHEVTEVSNVDFWKNNPREIDLSPCGRHGG